MTVRGREARHQTKCTAWLLEKKPTMALCVLSLVRLLPFFFTVLLLQQQNANAHSRWKCPASRSSDTGIKTGPCGLETNNFTFVAEEDLIEIQPGPLRVVFEESIWHRGSPFRIALSGDGSDEEEDVCVLLDHIQHNDNVTRYPDIYDPSTYVPYAITINIPDVQCDRCSLHMANPMTDKVGVDGAPDGIGCTDPNGSCFSVYHSCTLPFRIRGSTPRSEYRCSLPGDWPTVWTGDNGATVKASEPGVYRREASDWSEGLLLSVPEQYRVDAGGLCGPSGEIYELPAVASSTDAPSFGPTMMQPSASPQISSSTTKILLMAVSFAVFTVL